jgi:hypothetical protein
VCLKLKIRDPLRYRMGFCPNGLGIESLMALTGCSGTMNVDEITRDSLNTHTGLRDLITQADQHSLLTKLQIQMIWLEHFANRRMIICKMHRCYEMHWGNK